jgi:YVTN family beta-propeller protein
MKRIGLGVLVFAIAFSIYVNQDVFAHHVIEEIPVSSSPMGMSLSEDALYVSSFGYPHIDIIDLSTRENVGFITTSTSGIMDVAVVPDKNKIYAAPFESGGIDTYTLSTRLLIDTIPLPDSEITIQTTSNQPYGYRSDVHYVTGGWSLDYNPTNELLYVADYNSHLIYVIDSKTDKIVDQISVPRHPFDIKADPITNTVIVASLAGNEITFLKDVTGELSVKPIHEIVETIKVSGGPWSLDIDPREHLAYVANRGCECLTVIDIVTMEIVRDIPLGDKVHVVAVDSSEHQIYASYLTQNKIVKIDGNTNKIVSAQELSSKPWDIEVNPETHQSFVSLKNEDKIIVLGPQSKSFSMPVVTLQSPSAYVGIINVHGQDVDSTGTILDVDNFSLSLAVSSEDGGMAAIFIPRDVLDSKQNDMDSPFEARIDNSKVISKELLTDENFRIISVTVPKDAEIITVVGNKIMKAISPVEDIPIPEPVPIPPTSMEMTNGSKVICEDKVWIENPKGRIACVTPSTADKLVQRGWGTILGS